MELAVNNNSSINKNGCLSFKGKIVPWPFKEQLKIKFH